MKNLRKRFKQNKKGIDKTFLIITLVLVVLGLIVIADASAPQALNVFKDKFYFVKQQLLWAFGGFFVMLIAAKIPYSFWQKIATPLFIVSALLLIVVLLPGVGFSALGARRWIVFGLVNFQPSEIIKFSLPLFLAKLVSTKKNSIYFFVPLALVCGLIMLQPDLGTTIIIAVIGMSVLFLSDINIFYFLGALLMGALASIALILTSDYRRARLLTFFQMSQDPLGSDYHIRQILLALGTGGLFGIGLGQGKQKFLFLPEAATDSIFATIAEEVGFLGATIVIILFLIFIYKAFKIASAAPDKFSFLLAVGLSSWIAIQVLLNIGSMVALVPLTGVPLPFFSYGGSSLVMLFLAVGILLNISKGSKHA